LYEALAQKACYKSVTSAFTAVQEFKNFHIDVKNQYVERKLVPALQRVLGTIGIDVGHWCNAINWRHAPIPESAKGNQALMTQYFRSIYCIVCNSRVCNQMEKKDTRNDYLCSSCLTRSDAVLFGETLRASRLEYADNQLRQHCRACQAYDYSEFYRTSSILPSLDQPCDSLDCSVAYLRRSLQADLSRAQTRIDFLKKRMQLQYEEVH